MTAFEASGSRAGGTAGEGLSEEEIWVIIAASVVETTREAISDLFRSVNTTLRSLIGAMSPSLRMLMSHPQYPSTLQDLRKDG